MWNSRRVHEHIRTQIEGALCGRSVKWLAEEGGVSQSTLTAQMARPKFSLDVLLKVAPALREDIAYFLPHEVLASPPPPADEALRAIEAIIEAWREQAPGSPENG